MIKGRLTWVRYFSSRVYMRKISHVRPNKKHSFFRKCGWREKSSPGRPQSYLFLINFPEILSFLYWIIFLFLYSCFFFFFFACLSVFWNQEYIFRYTFDYASGWGIKKISSGRFPETRLLTWLEWDTFHPSLPACLFLFSSYVTLLFTFFFWKQDYLLGLSEILFILACLHAYFCLVVMLLYCLLIFFVVASILNY